MTTLTYTNAAGLLDSSAFGNMIPSSPEILVADASQFILAGMGRQWPVAGQRQVLELVGDLRYASGPEAETSPTGGTIDAINVYVGNRLVMSLSYDDPLRVRDFWVDPAAQTVADGLTIIGSSGANTLSGFGVRDATLRGYGGDDRMSSDGDDRMFGGAGNDSYSVYGDAQVIERAGGGRDRVVVEDGSTYVLPENVEVLLANTYGSLTATGNAEANVFRTRSYGSVDFDGGDGDDRLVGGGYADRLAGGNGDDVLQGGLRADRLDGGAGADRLVWTTANESRTRAPDIISGFESGTDVIDLSAVDGDLAQEGSQALDWIGSAAFSGEAGELRVQGTVLEADVDGDGTADFTLIFRNGDAVLQSDVLL